MGIPLLLTSYTVRVNEWLYSRHREHCLAHSERCAGLHCYSPHLTTVSLSTSEENPFWKQLLHLHSGSPSLPDKEEHAPYVSELRSLFIPLRNPAWLMMPTAPSQNAPLLRIQVPLQALPILSSNKSPHYSTPEPPLADGCLLHNLSFPQMGSSLDCVWDTADFQQRSVLLCF